ncbi:MAG: lipopolysaccharide kinase InaA family protein [Pseudomonadales bacterium]|jgi:tRNA A-37 threonylcarbamoyl transferase component Bud32|nr:lipopolysaccharide kinase InaA family protein [Pseudomonadales bacterium]MDP7144060.1 lipopolysaccharide kinase InaA family protein [Pseudomonadales bacterium]
MTAFVWNVDHEVSREIRSAFGSLDDVFSMQGEVVTRSPISALVKVDVAGKCYYVKKYQRAGKHLRRYVGRSRVRAEWENLQLFKVIGIPTPPVVAYGEEVGYNVSHRGALVTEEVTGTVDLHSLAKMRSELLNDHRWIDQVLDQLSGYVRTMHQHGFVHNDLKWRNILVTRLRDPKVYFIDCPQGRHSFGPMLTRGIVKDLACLDKVAKNQLSRVDRLSFFLKYRNHSHIGSGDRNLIKRILAFFEGRE